MKKSPIKRAQKKRYTWPPPVAPEDAYVAKERNPIHSVLTALPIIMLVVGLVVYYHAESEQASGEPIASESINREGTFTGISIVQSGMSNQHYFWVDSQGDTKGFRIKPADAELLQTLERGVTVYVDAAPTVRGSKKYWIWRLKHGDRLLIDKSLE